jgi:hypothetical protein
MMLMLFPQTSRPPRSEEALNIKSIRRLEDDAVEAVDPKYALHALLSLICTQGSLAESESPSKSWGS